MWLITLRDLQWRKRRFAFGVVGTALVFAVTLLLAGLSASIRAEAGRTVEAAGATTWLVGNGVSGPFSGISALRETEAARAAGEKGVKAADPVVVTYQTVQREKPKDITLFGYALGGLGAPPLREGRAPEADGEAVVDKSLGVKLGERFRVGAQEFTAVGRSKSMTLRGGIPNVYVPLEDAQKLVFEGRPLVTAVLVSGARPNLTGLSSLSADDVRRDVLRPFQQALSAIDVLQVLLWLVAVAIVGTLIYLSVLERLGDFAVLKAIGTSSQSLFISLTIQAMTTAIVSAAAAIALAYLLAPSFPLPIVLQASRVALLPFIALAVGMLASTVGLRRAVRVDPALAFGSV